MRNLLVLGLVLTIGCDSTPSRSQEVTSENDVAPSMSEVNIEAFAPLHSKGVRLIDVRTPEEYNGGRVPGAESVPLDALSAEHPAIASHPKSEAIYFICHSGRRSARAATALAEAGFKTVNVAGGTSAWIASGRQIEQ